MGTGVLLADLFPLEEEEGDEVDHEVHFGDSLAADDELGKALVVAGHAGVEIVAVLVLEGVMNGLFNHLC